MQEPIFVVINSWSINIYDIAMIKEMKKEECQKRDFSYPAIQIYIKGLDTPQVIENCKAEDFKGCIKKAIKDHVTLSLESALE